MNLTKEEKQFLGKQARIVYNSSGSIILWRWLHSITPFRPRSLAELYTTALRGLRHRTARILESEGYPVNCADRILKEYLHSHGSDSQFLEYLRLELSISPIQARICLDRIQSYMNGLPCLQKPAWEELGHYAWAESFLQTLTRTNETGTLPDELLNPIPAPRLIAVSHLAYSQSYVASFKDHTAEAKLADQLLGRRQRLVHALANHRNQGHPPPIFWNLPAFYAGTKSASDLAELQSYTDLLILLKAFAIVEHYVDTNNGILSPHMTIALCNIFWMTIGHLDHRDLKTMKLELSLSVPVKQIDLSGIKQRHDYTQALFHLNLSYLLPPRNWLKSAPYFYRNALALPKLKLSLTEKLAVLFFGVSTLINVFTNPAGLKLLLLFFLVLSIMYLLFRGGIEFLFELIQHLFTLLTEKYPILATLIILAFMVLLFKNLFGFYP